MSDHDQMNFNPEQVKAIDELDGALCQYLNNVGDEWDDPRWVVSVQRNLGELSKAYNECHRLKVMDIGRWPMPGIDEK